MEETSNTTTTSAEEHRKEYETKYFQRDVERKQKQELVQESKQIENQDVFWKEFNQRKSQLVQCFSNEKLQELQKFVNSNVYYLPNYDIRKVQDEIKDLAEKNSPTTKATKFSFSKKSKPTTPVMTPPTPTEEPRPIESYTPKKVFKNITETVTHLELEQDGDDFRIEHCTNSSLYLVNQMGSASFISHCNQCVIALGPITSSVWIESCTNCTFYICSQQIRIHKCENCTFYVWSKSGSIIEDCHGLLFGPYALQYNTTTQNEQWKQLEAQYNWTREQGQHKWREVKDFNWIKSNQKSPHFDLIDESKVSLLQIN